MKIVSFNFLNANNILIEEDNTYNETVIYCRSAKNGKWIAKAIAFGNNLKNACLDLLDSNEVDCQPVVERFERFLMKTNKKGRRLTQREYLNAYERWLRDYASGDLLFKLLCDKNMFTFVDWSGLRKDKVNKLGDTFRRV